jgi:hypothetical protein
MLPSKTHYEQVPMEMVQKILDRQVRDGPTNEQDQENTEKTVKEDVSKEPEQTEAGSGAFFESET